MTAPIEGSFTPAPTHRAIDQVTALRIRVQHLDRQLARTRLTPDQVRVALSAINRDLAELTTILSELHDRAQRGT